MGDKQNQTRDEVLLRMLKTPPKRHEPIGKRKKPLQPLEGLGGENGPKKRSEGEAQNEVGSQKGRKKNQT